MPPSDGRTTILLTGFGPFPSVPMNATMLLLPRMAHVARRVFPAVRIVTDILPTEWHAAPARVDALLALHQPDVVLHFGVSARARGFEIETRGHNVRQMAADARGVPPATAYVRTGGQHRLPARFNVAEIVTRLRRRKLPAYRSWSAGTYLCNAALYHVLAETRQRRVVAGFIHIPASLVRPTATLHHVGPTMPGCPLTWQQALDGALEIIAAALTQPSPAPMHHAACRALAWRTDQRPPT